MQTEIYISDNFEDILEQINCHDLVLINSVLTDWLQSFYTIRELKLMFMDRHALS